MNRAGRLVRALLVIGVLFGCALAGLRWYLSSAGVARQASDALQAMLGVPVEVKEASIGLMGGSSLRGLNVPEPGDPSRPLLAVEDVDTDLALGGVLSGATPRRLALSGVRLTVRLDRDGKLLTRLPESGHPGRPLSLPRIELRDLRLTLLQEGRPPMDIAASRAVVDSDEGTLKLTGSIEDPFWGAWAVSGAYHPDTGEFSAGLSADSADVTLKKLRSLPFVPAGVWEEVQVEGRSPVRVALRRAAGAGEVRYRVEAEPRSATVSVRAIGLTARETSGSAVIDDGVVRLKGVRGKSAGGTIATSGTLDFRGEQSRLKLDVAAIGLSVRELPASWGLPVRDGRLTGHADVELAIGGGKVTTHGSGEGRVEGVSFAGGTGTIELRLHGDGDRLRFLSATPVAHYALAPEFPGPAALAAALTEGAARVVGAAGRLAGLALDRSTAAVKRTSDLVSRAGRPAPPGEPPTYLDANLSFEGVQLAQLAERLEIKLPVPVSGQLSFRLRVQMPVNTPRDLRAYRLEGGIDLPTLRIGDVEFSGARARIDYRDGVLALRELSGRLPPQGGKGAAGAFRGSARLGVAPRGDLAFQLDVTDVPLARLDALLPASRRGLAGSASGRVKASAPFDLLGQPARWAGEASLTSPEASWLGVRVTGLDASARLRGGVLRVEKLRAGTLGGEVAGEATLPLRGEPGKADLRLTGVDVGAAVRAFAGTAIRVEGKLSGTVAATITPADGKRDARVWADVDVTAPDLRVQRVNAERLAGKLHYRDGRVEYDLRADALGGKVRLEGRLPAEAPRPADEPEGTLSLRGVALPGLLRALGVDGGGSGLRGAYVNADVAYRLAGRRPVGKAMVEVGGLAWGAGLPRDLRAEVELREEGVWLNRTTFVVGAGTVTLSLRHPYAGPGEFSAQLRGVESGALVGLLPGLEGALEGPVTARVAGTTDGEWSGRGSAYLARGKVYGVDVAEWRLPFSFRASPAEGRGRLEVPDATARLGEGRAQLRAAVSWGGGPGVRVGGSLSLFAARLGAFAAATGDVSRYAEGLVSGRADFGGSHVRSVNDLNASVQARLQQAQALRLPVLSALAPFLGQGRAATFHNGQLRGHLTGGVFRIDRLELNGRALELFIEGSVSVQGVLDLQAIARVSASLGCDYLALRAIALALPAAGQIPTAVVGRVTRLLADRVIHLRVTGTTRSPQVRVEPLRTLSDEAARYFTTRLLLPASPDALGAW